MTSRLQKCFDILTGRDKIKERRKAKERERAENDPVLRWERQKKRLEEEGALVTADFRVTTKENIAFQLSPVIRENTDVLVLLELFCDETYGFQIDPKEKAVVFDMGMNIGAATLFFANKENVTDVYSYEPFTPTYQRALTNIGLNPRLAKKIHPFNFGLGKENKTMEIPYNAEMAGDMSTTIDRLDYEERYHDRERTIEKVEVKDTAETLAPILKNLTDERVILKIDTEGAEFDILESLDSASLLKKIDFLMMEYHFRSPRVMEEALTRNGFLVWSRSPYRKGQQFGMIYAVNLRKE